jgi:hypothetical protein
MGIGQCFCLPTNFVGWFCNKKILGFFYSVNSTNFVHFWKDSPNFQYHKFEKKEKENPSMLIVGSLTSESFASKLIYFGVDKSVFQVARIGIT